jgi:hypothetical protein
MFQNANILYIYSAFETFSALLAGLIQTFNTASKDCSKITSFAQFKVLNEKFTPQILKCIPFG